MKWRFSLCLAVLLAAGLASCGGGDDNVGTDGVRPTATAASRERPTATAAQVQALAAVQVPGFTAGAPSTTALGAAVMVTVSQKTAGGVELFVRANFAPCDATVCTALDAVGYQSPDVQANLRSVLPAVHKDNPNLRWEFGEVALSKQATGLYYYALSYVETRTADGNVSRATVDSYRAWYHNGSVYVTLEVFARSPVSALSQADLEKTMTKAEAEQAARAVFAAIEPKLP